MHLCTKGICSNGKSLVAAVVFPVQSVSTVAFFFHVPLLLSIQHIPLWSDALLSSLLSLQTTLILKRQELYVQSHKIVTVPHKRPVVFFFFYLFGVVIWVNCVKIFNQNNLDAGLINALILTALISKVSFEKDGKAEMNLKFYKIWRRRFNLAVEHTESFNEMDAHKLTIFLFPQILPMRSRTCIQTK